MTSVESSESIQTPDETIAYICKLGQYTTHVCTDDILRRIHTVRDKCIQAEKSEQGASGGSNGIGGSDTCFGRI